MQAYIREILIDALIDSQQLASQYLQKEGRFIENALNWLLSLEQQFAKLRHPLSGMISAQRVKLVGATQGKDLSLASSKRKASHFVAVEVIEAVELQLRLVVESIDQQFKVWSDKIAQLAAISSRQSAIVLPAAQIGNAELKNIWAQFGQQPEGANMHQYLSAVMPQADLFYLLNDVISHLLSNTAVDS